MKHQTVNSWKFNTPLTVILYNYPNEIRYKTLNYTFHFSFETTEHGFRAVGDHIPTAPPIPLEIQKGLEQIYEGIKKNAERAKSDPNFAKQQEARAQADYYGHYIPSK